ncbi:hypothetical protein ILUMI_00271 [Ignelater luminosus]|uniref:DUF4817 domain-containing protein n=1 Tax=Ignelater luminosus TaxID=2038154 RepID=A0A8K0DKK0_IGNLU|nr:hypothetical protein ILUMI_00271 [Ignelater luminosus]
MAAYSNIKYVNILFMYGKADGNAAAAQRLYRERFPERRVPHVTVFGNTYRRMSETGNLNHVEPRANNRQHHPEIDEQILNAFDADPTTSTRKIARQLNLSIWKVWSVLHVERRHPFHYTPVQGLEEGDPHPDIENCVSESLQAD